jgi:hypothetical protein
MPTSSTPKKRKSRKWHIAAAFNDPKQVPDTIQRVRAAGDGERRLVVLGPSAFVLLSR